MKLARREQPPNLDARLEALRQVVEIGRDRFDSALVDDTRGVLDRGTARMGLGSNVTVVALAGATGTGKSSLFNKLSGTDLAAVGVRRPTTSSARAAVWGEANEVLDWLGVPSRHGMVDPELEGLVLLDLPDHDSTQVEHRLEVDRLVKLVDIFVWVVDPQKYADAALHDGYLRPLAGHAAVSVVVLNQVDKLTEEQRRQCVADLSRLLVADGLPKMQILSTSTVTGEGIASLQESIVARVREERAAMKRLAADLDGLAPRLAPLCGVAAPGVTKQDQDRLIDALASAAGVDVVTDALAGAHRRDAALAMGWPFTRWLRRFRPDPLARLHLKRAGEGGRTSLPEPTPVGRAQADNALRRVAGAAAEGLPTPWPDTVRRAVAGSSTGLLQELDVAISATDLGETDRPVWWSMANGLQTLLATVAVIGFAWLGLLFALEWLQIPRPPTPKVEEIPWPTLALVGGLLLGFLLNVLFQGIARLGAGRRKRRAAQRLREAIAQVAGRTVSAPIDSELAAYRAFCLSLERLRASG